MKIIEKKEILPGEVYLIIQETKKKRELLYIEERTEKYLEKVMKLDYEKQKELYEKLKEINIPESIRIKIIEILPKNEEELKTILYTYTLDKKDIEKILSIVKAYIGQ